jgi:hypothetical protein
MKTKISVKNRTVTWTGDKPELLKALEAVGFELTDTGEKVGMVCSLNPEQDLGKWFVTMQAAGIDLRLQLWEGKWKAEINGAEGPKEYKDIREAIRMGYDLWWKTGRMVYYKGEQFNLEELVDNHG